MPRKKPVLKKLIGFPLKPFVATGRGIRNIYRTKLGRKLSNKVMKIAREGKLEHIKYRDNPCAGRTEYYEDIMKLDEKQRNTRLKMLSDIMPELKEGEITKASITYFEDGMRDFAIVEIKNKEKPLVLFFDEKGKVKKK